MVSIAGVQSSSASAATTATTSSRETVESRIAAEKQAAKEKDQATFSEASKVLSKMLGQARGEVDTDESSSGDPVEKLKKKIEKLEKKIDQVAEGDLPEETKQPVIEGLRQQMSALQQELAQAMAELAKTGGGKSGGKG